MTAVPYDVPPALPTTPDQAVKTSDLSLDLEHIVFAQTSGQQATSRVSVQLTMAGGGNVSSAIFTLKDPATGAVIARSNVQGSSFSFYVADRPYLLQVEAPGCRIEQISLKPGGQSTLTVRLDRSSVPGVFQRIVGK
jgi:hypothetical protein